MKTPINTPNAPLPIGPYNQAVVFNDLVFVSGMIALNPADQSLVLDNIEAEAEQVLRNLQAVVEAAGSSLAKVLKATVFVKDMNDFSRINAVYARFFPEDVAPARELVQVAELPRFVNLEISVIAAL